MIFALKNLKMNKLVWTIVVNKFIYLISLGIIFSSIPQMFLLNNSNLSNKSNEIEEGLPSNGVIDIGVSTDSLLFYGTGGGLGKSIIENSDPVFFTIMDSNLPRGGNPALFVKDSIIVVSGVIDTLAQDEYLSKGTGISISQDYGESWMYYEQPIDSIPINGLYHYIDWYGEPIQQLAVTVAINNISYDVTVLGDYIYSASWAGGIRRIKFRNFTPSIEGAENYWEAIPLPLDNSSELNCYNTLGNDYSLDPNDPANGGNHNHKGFAVETQNDSIIWVGTANGVNKGEIDENNCISWTHYTSTTHNISGNWVIGFSIQNFIDIESPRIWAITWSTNSSERNGVSFSDDLGETWNRSNMLESIGLKVFNIYSKNERVYIASDKGLYYSVNGEQWEKLSRPVEYDIEENIVEEVLSNSVYSVAETNKFLWVGTGDGLGKTENLGLDWETYRFYETPITFYAYPNPFFVDLSNRINNDGHVRFICNSELNPNKILIYDFSMNMVKELNQFNNIDGEFEVIWNGENSLNKIVSNGVYFCNLISNKANYWTKIVVIN